MIIGIGVDLIEIDRVASALRRRPALWDKLFTPAEIAYCQRRKQQMSCLAARFAAKEAVMKALGCGWGQAGWRDIEVIAAPSGKPTIKLTGRTLAFATKLGVNTIMVSMSHGRDAAVAQAIACKESG